MDLPPLTCSQRDSQLFALFSELALRISLGARVTGPAEKDIFEVPLQGYSVMTPESRSVSSRIRLLVFTSIVQ